MPDVDDAFDPQDEAEVFDETHGSDEDPTGAWADDVDDDPDGLPGVYDVTTARGDADEDEDGDRTLDDYDADDLDDLDLDEEEEEADYQAGSGLDDDLEDEAEEDERAGLDRLIDRAAEHGAPIEPALAYVGDLDAVTNPRDDDVEKYETSRELSDEQLADLGYLDRSKDPKDPKDKDAQAVKDQDPTDQPPARSRKPKGAHWEERSFDREAEEAVLEDQGSEITGSGATADDVEQEHDPHQEDLLDEGLEETFPASDPVSAKHIT